MTTVLVHPNEQKVMDLISQRLGQVCSDKAEVKLRAVVIIRHGVPRRVIFEEVDEVDLTSI